MTNKNILWLIHLTFYWCFPPGLVRAFDDYNNHKEKRERHTHTQGESGGKGIDMDMITILQVNIFK